MDWVAESVESVAESRGMRREALQAIHAGNEDILHATVLELGHVGILLNVNSDSART